MTESERIERAWCNVNSLARSSDYCNESDHADIELIESIVKKEIQEKPKLISRDGCDDDEAVYDAWNCPYCGKHYQVNFDKYDYCPKCGHNLIIEAVACIPPIYKYYCFNCGWSHTTRDEIMRIPFGGNSLLMKDGLNAK